MLDFGLAKAFQPAASDASASLSPTVSLTAAATQMGMIIGTAAYMSPEQARGKAVDKRADVWAFGCVLFEMLTGRRVFDATEVSDVLALVLVKDADLTSVPTDVSPSVRALLGRCLTKEPKDRLRDIGEARLALRDAGRAPSTPEPAAALPRGSETPAITGSQLRVWQRPAGMSAVAVVALVVGGLAVWGVTRPSSPAPEPVARFEIPQSRPVLHQRWAAHRRGVSRWAPDRLHHDRRTVAPIARLRDTRPAGRHGRECP